MKRILSMLILISFFLNTKGDTLKVYVLGQSFKAEKFKFRYPGLNYTKRTVYGTDAFAFFIVIPDSLQDIMPINLKIYRKGRLSLKYKDTKTPVYYDSTKKYLILIRDYRMKNKYSFQVYWSNYPYLIHDPLYWKDNYIPEWAK